MKRLFIILCVGLTALSCWSRSDRFKVDIDKALKKRTDARELYSEASAIPLRFPDRTTFGEEIRLLDVAVDRFFLLDGGKKEILVFDWDGEYVTTIAVADSILDFSVYRDRVLDVLTKDAITEYSTTDGAPPPPIGPFPLFAGFSVLRRFRFRGFGKTIGRNVRRDGTVSFQENAYLCKL